MSSSTVESTQGRSFLAIQIENISQRQQMDLVCLKWMETCFQVHCWDVTVGDQRKAADFLFSCASANQSLERRICLAVNEILKIQPKNSADDQAKIISNQNVIAQLRRQTNKSFIFNIAKAFSYDDEIVYEALKKEPLALCFAGPRLRENKALVRSLVKRVGAALKYVIPSLKKDREIVKEAFLQDFTAVRFADPEIFLDRNFCLELAREDGWGCLQVFRTFINDKEVVLKAIKQNPRAYQLASDALKADREIAFVVVSQNGNLLKYSDDKIANDLIVALEAIWNTSGAYEYVGSQLKKDLQFIHALKCQNIIASHLKFNTPLNFKGCKFLIKQIPLTLFSYLIQKIPCKKMRLCAFEERSFY